MSDVDFNESGGQLRTKLETTLSENYTLREELAGLKAKDIIASEGYTHVKPEDLKGVALNELSAKAKELNEVKRDQLTELLTERFEAQGLQGSALEQAVNDLVNGRPATDPNASAYQRAQGAGGTGTPPRIVNSENLGSREKMIEGLKQQGRTRK